MPHTYHLLTEAEPFSEHHGGAISRWVANVIRFDSDSTVVAPSSDESWGFDPARVHDLPALEAHRKLLKLGGHHLPWAIRFHMLLNILQPALQNLQAGDTVWVHARPEFAAALEPFIHARGALLFLHLHNSHLVQWSTRVTSAVHADCYVFCSEYLRDEALAKFPLLHRTEVLVNGADPDMFYPTLKLKISGAVPTVLFASRLVPDKGLHVFLDAMRILKQDGIALRGLVVGSSGFGASKLTPYVLEMKAKAPDNVKFEPYRTGAPLADIFRNSEIYCLPACWNDPFPLTVLEAMATGIPVVASRSGGIPAQLTHGGGLLVARNSVAELVEALALLASNPTLRHEHGQRGLTSFRENFTWSTVRKAYRHVLSPCSALPMRIMPPFRSYSA